MASSQGLLLAVSLLVCASTCLGIDLAGHPARKLATTEPLAPTGLWQSISIVGSNNTSVSCGLRDFPPIPDGYGSSRMLCGGSVAKFDPYWVWKLTKIPSDSVPDVLAPGASNIVTGELVHLRIFNPMLTYCQTVSKGQVKCGVMFNQAALFSVEKVGNSAAGQQVDFNADVLYLKSNNMYCRLNGKASSSFIYCDQTTAVTATKFRMPYSHYYSVSLSSLLNSNQFCGANFIPLSGPSSAVNCTGTGLIPGNYYTKFVLSAKVPGSSFLSSGMAYAITAYDNLYHYQVATWMAAATGAVDSISNDTSGDSLWFILEIPEAAVGTPLDSGSVVLIKNQKLNKYCGLATGTSQMKCDMDAIPTSTGYLFTFSLA